MARTPTRILYDVHSMTIYDRATGEFQGMIDCLESASIEASGGIEYHYCNSILPAAAEQQNIELTLSGSLKALDDVVFEFLAGGSVTKNAAEPNGSVGTAENVNGTSMVDGTTGIASTGVKSGSESDVKTQVYILKAVSATTFDVFVANNINGETLLDDDNKINASPITLPGTGGTVEITGTGIELTGGSGAIALVNDDTAKIETRHFNNAGSSIITIDNITNLVAFGAIIATSRSNGDVFYVDCPNIVPSGAFSIGFESRAFSVNDFEAAIVTDPIKGYPYKVVHVRGAGA